MRDPNSLHKDMFGILDKLVGKEEKLLLKYCIAKVDPEDRISSAMWSLKLDCTATAAISADPPNNIILRNILY